MYLNACNFANVCRIVRLTVTLDVFKSIKCYTHNRGSVWLTVTLDVFKFYSVY